MQKRQRVRVRDRGETEKRRKQCFYNFQNVRCGRTKDTAEQVDTLL